MCVCVCLCVCVFEGVWETLNQTSGWSEYVCLDQYVQAHLAYCVGNKI